jgi:Ca2+-binding RTX toxin-like protein
MTTTLEGEINTSSILNCAINGSPEELKLLLENFCPTIGYVQLTSVDYDLMAYAICYYVKEANITLISKSENEENIYSKNLLTAESDDNVDDSIIADLLLKMVDFAGQAGHEASARISEITSGISAGFDAMGTITGLAAGDIKGIVGGLISGAAGSAAAGLLPSVMSSGLPISVKLAIGIGLIFVGDAVQKGIDDGTIDLPISDLPTFPKDLDDRFKNILEKNGMDPNGVVVDALNAYNTFMKNKNKNKGPSSEKASQMISPIIIDLDKDGIETRSIRDGVYFDHDDNSFIEKTGWVSSDDALLVRDTNHNGTIDSGKELFGNNTLLSDGTLAKNGYEALSVLDDNKDGVIDASDRAWSELSLWQDINSNGFTDTGELISISASDISGIKYNYQQSDYVDSNNNKHKQTSEVIMKNGEHAISTDVWFDVNKQNTYYIPENKIDESILKLPNITGMGNVTSLHEAMNNDPGLASLVKEFIAHPQNHLKDGLIEEIVFKWVGVQGNTKDLQLVSFINNITGSVFKQNGSTTPGPGASSELQHQLNNFEKYTAAQLLRQSEFAIEFSTIEYIYDSKKNEISLNTSLFESLLNKMEETNAERSLLIRRVFSDVFMYSPEMAGISSEIGIDELFIIDNNSTSPIGNGSTDSTTAYYIKPEFTSITINDQENSPSKIGTLYLLDFKATQAAFKKDNNDLHISLSENKNIILSGYFVSENHRRINIKFSDELISMAEMESMGFPVYGTDRNDSLSGWNNNDTLYGYAGNDSLYGNAGNDTLIGGTGDDTLNGGDGNDIYRFSAGHGHDTISDRYASTTNSLVFEGATADQLQMKRDGNSLVLQAFGSEDAVTLPDFFYNNDFTRFELVFDDRTLTRDELLASGFPVYGTDRNDSLSGWNNNDTLYGYNGNDSLYGEKGNDTLIGGTGDDSLNGGDGNDIYRFTAGHGHDTLSDRYASTTNSLVFEGATADQLQLRKDENSLVLQVFGAADSVTLKDFFSNNDFTRFELIFDDRTVTRDELLASGFPVYGTDRNESLSGWKQNDTLYGYAGNDSLYGDKGNDTLIGGTGDDSLSGGDGDDTYHFTAGHGHDTLSDSYAETANTLVFTGATSDSLLLERSGNSLILRAFGGDDSVILQDYFINASYQSFSLVFDDRTLSSTDFAALGVVDNGTERNDYLYGSKNNDVIYGAGGNDNLNGYDGDDIITAGTGDDTLEGGQGNDVLDGGVGNDYLNGGAGDDTFYFSAGHGQDSLTDMDAISANRLVFTGATSDQLTLSQHKGDLVLHVYESGDALTIKNYYQTDKQHFELVFDDRTVTADEFRAREVNFYGTEGNDSLSGFDGDDHIWGYAGNDCIYGNEGADTIYAGAGDDTIYGYGGDNIIYGEDGKDTVNGGSGDEIIIGGAGDDNLSGSDGADKYYFKRGHDNDIVFCTGSNGTDQLIFKGASSNDVKMQNDGASLIIRAYGDDDSVKINRFFQGDVYRNVELVFDDRTITKNEMPEFIFQCGGGSYTETFTFVPGDPTLPGNPSLLDHGNPLTTMAAVATTVDAEMHKTMPTSETIEMASIAAQAQLLVNSISVFGHTLEQSGLQMNHLNSESSLASLVTPQ